MPFISDFRNLNQKLKHKAYKIPKTNEILLKLKCFKHDILILDLLKMQVTYVQLLFHRENTITSIY